MNKEGYSKLVEKSSPNSTCAKDYLLAFLIGGAICCLGEAVKDAAEALGATKDAAGGIASVSLIFLSALMTGLGLYQKLARHAGAGTLVPITGFANAVVSPAIEFKSEGYILGLGAKMFIIAGPVIVYGVGTSVIYGLIYWITSSL